jgi:hypothetical protein
MYPSILTKLENYVLWQSGAFGNKLRAWRTVEKWREAGFKGRVVLRTLGSAGGGPTYYNLEPGEVDKIFQSWIRHGVPNESIMVNEAAPDNAAILQGEYRNDVYKTQDGYDWGLFHFSRAAAHMRPALARAPEERRGLMASLLIREAMTPSSYDDWLMLIDRYPGHVLEVSIYDRCLGDVPGRNALVWEVRRY